MRDESLMCSRLSMFDNVACAHLCLTLPGWLLCLCLMCSMCACAQWLICHVLAHKASLSTFVIVIAVDAVAIAITRRHMKMPCACGRGLVVDICPFHQHSCCCRCHHAMQYEKCHALAHEALLSTFVLVITVVVVAVAVAQRNVKILGACARGFVDDFVVFIATALVVIAAVQCNVLLCICTQGLVAIAVLQRNVLSCTCT
jgi:hypothetical protein